MESTSQIFGNGLKYFGDLLAIELRNMEAIGLAQQKMLEGMGMLARRQAEIAEETLRRSFGAGVRADLGFRRPHGSHRADHVAQDHDAGKPDEFEHPV